MRKALTLLTAMTLLPTATAQTMELAFGFDNFRGDFKGCRRVDGSTVTCSVALTRPSSESYDSKRLQMGYDIGRIVSPSGEEVFPTKSTIGNLQLDSTNRTWGYFTFYDEVPVLVTFVFKGYTANNLARFYIGSGYLTNVPVQGAAAPTPTPGTVKLPTTQAFIGGKAYSVSFANCKVSSNGAYVCTSTVSPSR